MASLEIAEELRTSSRTQAELVALMSPVPRFGTAGIILHFHDGKLVRIERTCIESVKV